MFGCFGAKVVELHRVCMGNLKLPEDLEEGQCRELTDDELKLLQQQL
jgi:16S rRNA pseudouridine516 synthase